MQIKAKAKAKANANENASRVSRVTERATEKVHQQKPSEYEGKSS